MALSTPLVITISREVGSGGAYIGRKLAEKLNMIYADQDIISKTAEKLSVFTEDVGPYEEKISSFWENFWANTGLHEFYSEAVGSFRPTTAMIYKTQSEVIQEIAKDHAAVIIGRGGFHVLRNHPNAVHIYLHADVMERAKRLMEVRKISELEARTQIAAQDKERELYIKKFTKNSWADVSNYDLSINTGKVGFDNAYELILKYIEARIVQ